MIAILVSTENFILAVRHRATGRDFWLPMWTNPAQAEKIRQHLGPEWVMIICQNPNPTMLCQLLASMVQQAIRGYVFDPGPRESRVPISQCIQ
jgi:hypothetical protein